MKYNERIHELTCELIARIDACTQRNECESSLRDIGDCDNDICQYHALLTLRDNAQCVIDIINHTRN